MQSVEASVMRVERLVACMCARFAGCSSHQFEAQASKGDNAATTAYDGGLLPDV